jgi:hypothetical protein
MPPPWLTDFVTSLAQMSARVFRLLWCAINSNFGVNFGVAVAGAAGGGLAGAWAAQAIADRNERRKALLSEIRATNAAVNLVGGIVNTQASIKRQFILPILAELTEVREKYSTHKDGVFVFSPELRIVKPIQTPIDRVGEILFDKINSDHFTLSIYQMLALSVMKSHDILIERNAIITEINNSTISNNELLQLYLGLQQPSGKTDERYPSLASASLREADDVIMFGTTLAQRLADHSKSTAQRCGKGAPKAAIMSTSRLEKMGLMPDAKQYENLLADLRGESS